MKIDKKIQELVIFDYLNTNLKTFEIANKYSLCRQSIRHIILENNLKLRDNKTNIKIINEIISDYSNGITNKIIANKFNLNRCVVQNILLKNNVKLRLSNETSRKHKLINENYFNIIDTEEKAYILGLLYADGNINNNGFEIALMEDDTEILEKISMVFYNKIILGHRDGKKYSENSNYFSKPQSRLMVASHIIKNDLIKHGCMERKTFKIRFPELINENVYCGFIRGYFDGDGCICIPTKHPQNVVVTITSNTSFCDGLAEYVRNTVGVNMKSCLRYKDVSMTRLTGSNQVIKFMNWLYTDSTIHLARKYNKYQNFLTIYNK